MRGTLIIADSFWLDNWSAEVGRVVQKSYAKRTLDERFVCEDGKRAAIPSKGIYVGALRHILAGF